MAGNSSRKGMILERAGIPGALPAIVRDWRDARWWEKYTHERDAAAKHVSQASRLRVRRSGYRLVSRQPAASASSTEQNQRVPLLIFISIFAYQRLVGLW